MLGAESNYGTVSGGGLETVSKLLEDQIDFSRAVALEQWLREGGSSARRERKGALTLIPPAKIWDWIDKDMENRAWYVAYRFVPKTLSAEEWPASLVRAFLIRYGEREDVRRNLRANYSTEVWQGSLSLHYKNKQQSCFVSRMEKITGTLNDGLRNLWRSWKKASNAQRLVRKESRGRSCACPKRQLKGIIGELLALGQKSEGLPREV